MFRTNTLQSTAAPVHELLASDIPFQGYDENTATTSYADFHIYYHYANSSDTNTSERVLRKPIIMLDGIDFGDIRNYKEIYETMLAYPEGHLGQELRKKGYDLIILNFPVAGTKYDEKDKTEIDIPLINGNSRDGGNDYIERNAFLLVKLIQTVNERLRQNGSNEKLVIVGPSMGGQISRYALAYMEKKEAEGVANMKHNTKLWVSFDSPHEGANIPLAGQRSMIYLGFITGNQEARKQYFTKLGNPASKQMLIEQFETVGYEYNLPNYSYYDYKLFIRQNGTAPFHQTYYNALKSNGLASSNGWPKNLKKIALVNGSGNGSKIWTEGQEFLNLYGKATIFGAKALELKCSFLPRYGETKSIFTGWARGKFSDEFTVYQSNSRGSMDNVPGGLFNTAQELKQGFSTGFNKVSKVLFFNVNIHPQWRTLLDNNSFIPTVSALGFKNPNFDWSQPVNNRNLVQTGEIYFDDYYAPATNEQHVTLTANNVAWLNNWLENVKNDTINICDINYTTLTKIEGSRNIVGASFFRLNHLPVNATVSWRIDNNPGFSQYPTGDNDVVIIKNGIVGSATLTAQINYNCGIYEVSLPIYSTLSIPDFNIQCIAYCPVNSQSYSPSKNYLFMSTTEDPNFSGQLADYQWNLYHFDNNPNYSTFVSNIGTYKNTYFKIYRQMYRSLIPVIL